MKLLAALAFLALAAPAAAKPGDLDRSFGRGGVLSLSVGPDSAAGRAVMPGRDGHLLLAGADLDGVSLIALRGHGTLTARWTAPIGTFYSFYPSNGGMTRDARGRTYVVAVVRTVGDVPGPVHQLELMRFLAAGGVDASYRRAPFHAARSLFPGGLAVAPDGSATVAATLGEGTRSQLGAVRFRPDGRPDRRFGRGGLAVVADHASGDAVVLRGSTAIVGGGARAEHSPATFVLAELDDRGRPLRVIRDRVARRPGRLVSGIAELLVEPAGTLLAAGTVGQGFDRHIGVARYDARGRRLALGIVPGVRSYGRALALDRRGRAIVAGEDDVLEAGSRAVVARLPPALKLDRTFGVTTFDLGFNRDIVASEVSDVAVTSGGRIVVAGSTYDDDPDGIDPVGRSYFAVARLLAR